MSQLSHAQFPLRRHPDLLVDHRRARSAAVAEPRGANAESRDRLRWPASFRNGGRHQIGTAADIKSESPAGLRRNSQCTGAGSVSFAPVMVDAAAPSSTTSRVIPGGAIEIALGAAVVRVGPRNDVA